MRLKFILLTLSGCILFNTEIFTQDCNTPQGVLALMNAPVILNVSDVDDVASNIANNSPLIMHGQTKIFLNPSTTPSSTCANAIRMYVFYSNSQQELSNFPTLAAQSLTGLFTKLHIQAGLSATADPNIKNCSATLQKTGTVPGQVIYYRWAKLIDHPTDADPITWSSTFSFTVPESELLSMLYDVELELDKLVVSNVRDLDGTEDFRGNIKFFSLKALGREYISTKVLWPNVISVNDAPVSLKNGTYGINKRISLIKNLRFDELRNIELEVGGAINDEELGPDIPFYCEECPVTGSIRQLKFKNFPSTQTSIFNLQTQQTFQELKFGEDKYFELNYYELQVKSNGWAKFMFKVWVKPHR